MTRWGATRTEGRLKTFRRSGWGGKSCADQPVMELVAMLCFRAQKGDALEAASQLLGALEDRQADIVERLLDFAHLPLHEIEDWERVGHPVLIRGSFGLVWYVPTLPRADVQFLHPVITPRGLRALAQGVVDLLTLSEEVDPASPFLL